MPNFADIVAQAARDGLFVLPACLDPSEKHPCIRWKEFQTRRPIEAEVAKWVVQYPARNGVYLTGEVLGRFVVDLDSESSAEWFGQQGAPLTQTLETHKGWHLHFQWPDFQVRTTAGVVHEGVDIRGHAGVAMASGSIHKCGHQYRWVKGRSPQDVALASAPEWLLDILRPRPTVDHPLVEPRQCSGLSRYGQRALRNELDRLSNAGQGTRNFTCAQVGFRLGQLVAGGELAESEVLAALLVITDAWPNPEKTKDTLERALSAGALEPRTRTSSWRPAVFELGNFDMPMRLPEKIERVKVSSSVREMLAVLAGEDKAKPSALRDVVQLVSRVFPGSEWINRDDFEGEGYEEPADKPAASPVAELDDCGTVDESGEQSELNFEGGVLE
jgi:hypothetical protein